MRRSVARGLGELFAGLPVTEWAQALSNAIRQLGLGFVLLSTIALVVYLDPSGFTAGQRFLMLAGIFVLMLLSFTYVFVLSLLPGDRAYAPYERQLEKGQRYGTKEHPKNRRAVMDEQRVTIEGVPELKALPEPKKEDPSEPEPK